jgi:acid phosphatase
MAPPSPSLTIERIIIAIAIAVIAFLWTSRLEQEPRPVCPTTAPPESLHPGILEDECAGKPHHASWGSWWHPERVTSHSSQEGAGARTKDWNILYHLGGNGPWVEKVDNVVEGGLAPPEGCVVEQVHMVCSALCI